MRVLSLGCLALLAACGSHLAATDTDPFHEVSLALPKATDTNPDPHVVEVTFDARVGSVDYLAGKPTPAWTYDGLLPGPLIEAHVGDKLVVHFTNHLAEPTTIHWHGVRVPAAMDGTQAMQTPIRPGGTFTYEFTLPEAGLFWYHPHMRSAVQVEKGLYGALIVRGDDQVQAPERILVLDDVLLSDDGTPLPTGSHSEDMMGRDGNVAMINGHVSPAFTVQPGSWERWRLVNVSNARYYKLALPGHALVQIGTDGGWLEAPQTLDSLMLAPGERADAVVHFDQAPGTRVRLTSLPYTRGHGVQVQQLDLAEVRYASGAVTTAPSPIPAKLATIAPLDTTGTVRTFKLTERMGESDGGATMGSTIFEINGESWPNVTPLHVALGATEVWEVVNDTEMDHPFHLHGFFFQPLKVGDLTPPMQWKDTLNLPAKQTMRFAVQYKDHPGSFMYHCHILEHAELGMMGELVVDAP